MQTLNITSYQQITAKLAKVVVSTTGVTEQEDFRDLLCAKLDYQAAPVEGSFRQVRAGVAVGFVRQHREIRPVTETELKANYRVLSSNIMMDKEDQTRWEVKHGEGGSYLARHGAEDLSELLEASVYHARQDVPKVQQITAGNARLQEIAAFVTSDGRTQYGHVIRTGEGRCQVVNANTQTEQTVSTDMIAGYYTVDIPQDVHERVTEKLAAALSPERKAKAVDYFTTLYQYSPDYMKKVIENIENSATA